MLINRLVPRSTLPRTSRLCYFSLSHLSLRHTSHSATAATAAPLHRHLHISTQRLHDSSFQKAFLRNVTFERSLFITRRNFAASELPKKCEPNGFSDSHMSPQLKPPGPLKSLTPEENSTPVTKSELLRQATTPASRLWVHIKWPLTRNDRPFSLDDFSAFASWLVLGQVLWIVLGTTTFVLSAMYFIDTLDQFWQTIHGEEKSGDSDIRSDSKRGKQDATFLSKLAGHVLSHGLGAQISFERGNVLPSLEDGMLKFRNVTLQSTSSSAVSAPLDFTARISALNLSLSFKKWYDGKGLIDDLEISGMRAKVSRNNERSDVESVEDETRMPTYNSWALSFSGHHDTQELLGELDERNPTRPMTAAGPSGFSFLDSAYELHQVKIRDSYLEVHENSQANAFKISIFNCDLPRLRGDRLLIDFFNANIVTGTVNNSMFTIHKHQTFLDSDNTVTFKLDGIDMGKLATANPKSKFNWLVSGKAEIVADIRLPTLEFADSSAVETSGVFSKVLGELGDLTNPKPASGACSSTDGNLLKGALMAIYETFAHGSETEIHTHDTDYVIVNAKVKFTDLKASLPPHLPMASSASVPFITLQNLRSLISYINGLESEKPLVIKTTVIERLADLYNVDNISQTRMYDAIIGDIYDELLRMIKLDEKRIIREKSSMWSHSVMSQLLLLGLGVLA
ncbi:hypothetical protein OXX80_000069 [Metschnikowia pulcherrima]